MANIVVVPLLILAVVFAWPSVSEFFAVDRCLDAGGSFNYASDSCDLTTNHPYVGVWEGHAFSLVGALLSVVFAIAILILGSGHHAK
jgi:ABC-type phosphate/phosphonate transport system permease subunit